MQPFANVAVQMVGLHKVQVLDDTILMRFHGDYLPDEARVIWARIDEVGAKQSQVCLLVDLQAARGPTPETRRILADGRARGLSCQTIYFGSNPLNRAFIHIIHAAMRVLGDANIKYCTFAHEADALKFWAARRR